jgi:hypothetical protein
MRHRFLTAAKATTLIPLVAAAAVLYTGSCNAADPALHADLSFACKWWSAAQMEGLNPNAPPPKNTEVKIKKWEYSDPIGVPHPDVIEAVLALKNSGSEEITALEIEITGQWQIGPLKTPARALWSGRTLLKKFQGITVGPSGTQTLRAPVDLKTKMDTLYKQGKWPHMLRITATVRRPGMAAAIASSQADLPILPAD